MQRRRVTEWKIYAIFASLKHIDMRLLIFTIFALLSVAATAGIRDNARAEWFRERAQNSSISPEKRICYYDSLFSAMGRETLLIHYADKISLCDSIFRFDLTDECCDRALRQIGEQGDKEWKLFFLYNKGVAQMHLGRTAESILTCYEMLRLEKPDSLVFRDADAYCVLANVFLTFNKATAVERYLDLAKRVANKYAADNSGASREFNILRLGQQIESARAIEYLQKNDLTKGFEIMKRLMETDKNTFHGQRVNWAYMYMLIGEHKKAEIYLKQILESDFRGYNRLVAANNYFDILTDQKRIEEARALEERYRDDFKALQNTPLKLQFLSTQSRLLALEGDYAGVYAIQRGLMAAQDSLRNSQYAMALEQMAGLLYEKQECKENTRTEVLPWIIAGAIALLCAAVCVVVTIRWRHCRKELAGLNESMDRSRREKRSISEKSLEERNRELSAMTIHMARLTEALDEIQREADSYSQPEERIESIRHTLKGMASQENLWEMFRIYFSEVNNNFFANLTRLHPDLTPAETRMAAFMITGLSTKEIASLTNRSVRTIENIKYSLRRKLGIEERTETYLRHLAAD